MPPNTGELSFEDLENTIDVKLLKNPEGLVPSYHATYFNITVNKDETKNQCKDVSSDLNETMQGKDDNFSDSYWEWPAKEDPVPVTDVTKEINKEEFLKKIVLEEDIRQCLSVEQIEKRLSNDTNSRKQEAVLDDTRKSQNEDVENYWYWSDGKNIKEGLTLTVDAIEERIVADAKARLVEVNNKDYELANPADIENANGYWDWKEDKVVSAKLPREAIQQEADKEELLKNILLEEEIREALTVKSIEKNLVKEMKMRGETCLQNEIEVNKDAVDYWNW
mmetsp:Transcript_34140/g.41832  ORF Transcript_34140/g.41832 Transcript_34140/m.41832 type:complete len:279 (+) Transcript_34140:49-885(+)